VNNEWLQQYLAESVREGRCTRIYCTTCGAREFRKGLIAALEKETGQPRASSVGADNAFAIVHALTNVRPFNTEDASRMEQAVRLILFEIWRTATSKRAEREWEPLLNGTWAGDVLARMKAHHERLQIARRARAEYESPLRVEERRAQKRKKRQEAHALRLALKVERDRLWREGQKKVGK
jgi:hypothetical protein